MEYFVPLCIYNDCLIRICEIMFFIEIILLGILAILPQLGPLIYSYIPNNKSLRVQILNKSVFVFSYARIKFFVGGIIINDPRMTNEESVMEFVHKIQDYLPLTLKISKSSSQAHLYIYLFDFNTKINFVNNFDERVETTTKIFETLFTPRNIHILTGMELIEAFRSDFGIINFIEDNHWYISNKNKYSSMIEMITLNHDDNWKPCIHILNCLIELGLEVNLSFKFIMDNQLINSVGQIRISGDREESIIGGLNILRKGGILLQKHLNNLNYGINDFNHEIAENALQLVPYTTQEINLRNFANHVLFCLQNTSNSRNKPFNVPNFGKIHI